MSKIIDVDWVVVKAAYVESNKTTAKIAEEFCISKDAVEAQCTKGKWVEARRKLSEEVERRLAAEAIARKLKALDEMNESDIILSKAIKAQVSLKLQGGAVRDPATGAVTDTKLSAKDIAALSSAHTNAQKAGRLAIGMSTENQAFAGTVVPAEPPSLDTPDAVTASKIYQEFISGSPAQKQGK